MYGRFWEGPVFLHPCSYLVGHHDDIVLSHCLRDAGVHEAPEVLGDDAVQGASLHRPATHAISLQCRLLRVIEKAGVSERVLFVQTL